MCVQTVRVFLHLDRPLGSVSMGMGPAFPAMFWLVQCAMARRVDRVLSACLAGRPAISAYLCYRGVLSSRGGALTGQRSSEITLVLD